jgi:NADH-quinone oxidoreductase subunit N
MIIYNNLQKIELGIFEIPEFSFGTAIVLLICLGLYLSRLEFKSTNWLSSVLIGFSILTSLLFLYNLFFLYNLPCYFTSTSLYLINDYALFCKFLLVGSTIIFFLLSLSYVEYEKFKAYEFSLLVLLAVLGMLLVISSNDLILFYVGLELQSLPLYILASLKYNRVYAVESGLKYFIMGSVASCLILFGISLIYGVTGLTNFSDYALFCASIQGFDYNLVSGIALIFLGVFFKLGLFPFSNWIPDVYEGAPTIITLFFSVVPKIALLNILTRFVTIFFIVPNENYFYYFLLVSSVCSIIYGTLGALLQTRIKRLLAFSTIANTGFIGLSFCVGNFAGLVAGHIYFIIYILITFGIFSFILGVRNEDGLKIKRLSELKGLFFSAPIFCLLFCVNIFSLAGLPPMAGFLSKLLVFYNLVYSDFFFLCIFILLITVISVFYYLRLIRLLFFDILKDTSVKSFILNVPFFNSIVLFFSSLINLIILFLPVWFIFIVESPLLSLSFYIFI